MLRVVLSAEHQEPAFPADLGMFPCSSAPPDPSEAVAQAVEQGSLTHSPQAFPQSTSAEQQSLHGMDLILCLLFPNERLSSGMWVAVRSACGFLAHP